MGELLERLARMEALLDRLDRSVCGDTQPGLIQRLEAVQLHTARLEERIADLEEQRHDHTENQHRQRERLISLGSLAVALAALIGSSLRSFLH